MKKHFILTLLTISTFALNPFEDFKQCTDCKCDCNQIALDGCKNDNDSCCLGCCCNGNSNEPLNYTLDFPRGDNPLNITVDPKRSNNYFLILGDWGSPNFDGSGSCQKEVAD